MELEARSGRGPASGEKGNGSAAAESRRLWRGLLAAAVAAFALPGVSGARPSERQPTPQPSLLLLTLDTTRADHLGCYGSSTARTPSLDALAASGTRYARAVTPSPLTLPAHASLFTGLLPPEHGLRDNGSAKLSADVPTLAALLSAHGYATGAVVASRVLDRRFGLDRGFDLYDDDMTAEQTGQYGYPERDAAAVTSAAIAWLSAQAAARPFFLWVHYYDPHQPYSPPDPWRTGSAAGDYAGEIAYMDREIGRLLAALPATGGGTLVAAVGDHGEALGEHGERGHGVFLYGPSLDVPLILSGPGVSPGQRIEEVVGSHRLASTLLRLLGLEAASAGLGPALPGVAATGARSAPAPVYSETWMPANAYGWSPLKSLTDPRWRLVVAPRPELYDLSADPGETRNLFDERRSEASRLRRELATLEARFRPPAATGPGADAALAAELRSLGYLAGSRPMADPLDPKDGIALLSRFEEAKELMAIGATERAHPILEDLVRRSPGSIPFLTQLANARLVTGDSEAALATYGRALALNPDLDFLHLNLAEGLRVLGRWNEAQRSYRKALELNPRLAKAWLGVAEAAFRQGDAAAERVLLLEAVEAGVASAAVRIRLGEIEAAAGSSALAEGHLREATRLAPSWPLPWLLWGDLAERGGRAAEAAQRYREAARVDPANTAAWLRLGRVLLALGERGEGKRCLERAVALAPASAEGREARALLEEP